MFSTFRKFQKISISRHRSFSKGAFAKYLAICAPLAFILSPLISNAIAANEEQHYNYSDLTARDIEILKAVEPDKLEAQKRNALRLRYLQQCYQFREEHSFESLLDASSKGLSLRPEEPLFYLFNASALAGLGHFSEAESILSKHPPDLSNNDEPYLIEKIEILTKDRKYEEAIKACTVLAVGSETGKAWAPFSSVQAAFPNAPLERLKIELAIGNRPLAIAEAKKAYAWYCGERPIPTKEAEELIFPLLPSRDVEPVTDMETELFQKIDALVKMGPAIKKEQLEKLFGRQFFEIDNKRTLCSIDGSQLFASVLYREEIVGGSPKLTTIHSLHLGINTDKAIIPEKDWELHYGKALIAESSTFSREQAPNASISLRSGEATLQFSLLGKRKRMADLDVSWSPQVVN